MLVMTVSCMRQRDSLVILSSETGDSTLSTAPALHLATLQPAVSLNLCENPCARQSDTSGGSEESDSNKALKGGHNYGITLKPNHTWERIVSRTTEHLYGKP